MALSNYVLWQHLANNYKGKRVRVHQFYDDPVGKNPLMRTDFAALYAIEGVLTEVFEEGIELDENRIVFYRWVREIDYIGDVK